MMPEMPSMPSMSGSDSVEGMQVAEVENEPEAALAEMQQDGVGAPLDLAMLPPAGEGNGVGTCTKVANFRDSFYPGYVNMTTDGYDSRVNSGEVDGYDPSAAYASA
jgi:hypothetical protein